MMKDNGNNDLSKGEIDEQRSLPSTTDSLCPYSIYSLQFFLVFPLAKASQNLGVPTPISYLLALVIPAFFLNALLNSASKGDHIEHVAHSLDAKTDHIHSSGITLSVILHSAILSIIFTIGLSFISDQLESHFVPFGFYMILLSTFHFSEYFVTSLTNPSTLTISSFLIDQSSAYLVAISCSIIEYLLEAYLMPNFKKFNIISMLGLMIAIMGEVIRKSAMFTAGKNFSHFISVTKSPEHKLVTHGIYSIFRHPSYAGWFYWAVGSQIMLLNPICVVLFAVISYKFFKDRITYEESLLIRFFKDEYIGYRKRVRVWMPISL